jgi:hypothetical protein
VEDLPAALDRAGHRIGLADVAAHHLDRAALERPQATGRTGEDLHAVTIDKEEPGDIGSHEAGSAGDQHVHAG